MTDMTDSNKKHASAKEIKAIEANIKKGMNKHQAMSAALKGRVISQLGGKNTGKTITALPSKAPKITNSVPAAAQGGKKGHGQVVKASISVKVQARKPNQSNR